MRITEQIINAQIDRLNRLAGQPPAPYKRVSGLPATKANPTGTTTEPCPGNYHLDHAYGGVCLHQMAPSGGVEDVFRCGHVPKRELYERISAFIDGYQQALDDHNPEG
mgnify:CR=1 FL=1